MEIRRVEGIIPIEGIHRDLPLKLENFSYYEMKKLLSQIAGGEQKGKATTEFETLLRAVFLGYEGKRRGRFKLGNSEFTARLEVDREFTPGEEVLLRLKGVGESIELSIVHPVGKKLSEVLKGELSTLLAKVLKFPSKDVLSALLPIVEREYPELLPGFKLFLSSERVYSPYLLLSLLLLTKPEVRSELENRGVKLPSAEELKTLINQLIGLYSLYSLLGVLEVPVYIDDGFKGKVFYKAEKEGVSTAFVEVETGLGEFRALFKLLGKNVSVEYWASEEILKRLDEAELKERLKAVGLNPLLVGRVKKEDIENFKRELLKGEGISVNLSV